MATRADVEESIRLQHEHALDLGHTLHSLGHYAIPHNGGYRIPFFWYADGADQILHVHVLPWSRGWSIFVSPHHEAGVHNWRDVPAAYKHMQRPLYAPKHLTGPHHVPVDDIIAAVEYIFTLLQDFTQCETRRLERANQRDLAVAEAAFRRKLNERTRRALASRARNHPPAYSHGDRPRLRVVRSSLPQPTRPRPDAG